MVRPILIYVLVQFCPLFLPSLIFFSFYLTNSSDKYSTAGLFWNSVTGWRQRQCQDHSLTVHDVKTEKKTSLMISSVSYFLDSNKRTKKTRYVPCVERSIQTDSIFLSLEKDFQFIRKQTNQQKIQKKETYIKYG